MNIAFTWTALPLLLQEKTVTRRVWKPRYSRMFTKGRIVTAYDQRSDRGGRPLAIIQITETPYLERTGSMPDEDFNNEGLPFFDRYPELRPSVFQCPTMADFWSSWKAENTEMWVVRFRLLDLLPDGGEFLLREAQRYLSLQPTLL